MRNTLGAIWLLVPAPFFKLTKHNSLLINSAKSGSHFLLECGRLAAKLKENLVIRLRSSKVLTAFAIVLLTLIAGTVGLFLLSLTASRPSNLGVRDGRLAACPDSPNCVSTQAEDRENWIAPLTYQGDSDAVIETLAEIVLHQPRTRIIERSPHYLRTEFQSAFFRFVDDVEFYVEAESGRVHFRSASRVGRSDMGVNRTRMELIRSQFQSTQSAAATQPDSSATPLRLQSVR